jgi:FKBP-type peptidyl-prolyl cis-trans isomerase
MGLPGSSSRVIFALVNLRGHGGHDSAASHESEKHTIPMKINILAKLAVCCLALQAGGPATAWADDAALKTEKEKTSYALGVNIGGSLQNYLMNFEIYGMEIDTDLVVKGLKDTLADNPKLLAPDELDAIFKAFQAKLQAKQAAKHAEQEALFKEESAKDNAKEGAEFLAKNKTAPGVQTLTNGIQYTIITAGTGPIPKPTDNVNVNYRGMFVDGKEFDSSHGKTFLCSLMPGPRSVIEGWQDILKLMPAGSKWKVVIPPDLAYHAQGQPPAIPPNATLIFEMELVSIVPAK